MHPLVTVLYEDSKRGQDYPLHFLVLRMVEDDIDGQTWKLRKAVLDNPRKGIDRILSDVKETALIAGAGKLFVLADRDRITEHLNQTLPEGAKALARDATEAEVIAAVRARSDAPVKLEVFLLTPNLEGLLAAIEECTQDQPLEGMVEAKAKDRVARDLILKAVAKATLAAVRACVRARQPGLDALVKALADSLPRESIA